MTEAEQSFVVRRQRNYCEAACRSSAQLCRKKSGKAVLLYYFFDMTEREIAEVLKSPEAQYSIGGQALLKLLKRYLEERADEWND